MHRYWIGFYAKQLRDNPPKMPVLGAWNTGKLFSSYVWVMCAVVEAQNIPEAKQAINENWSLADDPWRFVLTKPEGWFVDSDRFPKEDWMRP